jgi:hypothetical protein
VRALATAVLAVVLGAAAAGAARGDALSDEARRRADEVFAAAACGQALYADLDVVLRGATEPLDREPLLVRELYWRPAGQGSGRVAEIPPSDDLAGRRRAWLAGKGRDAQGALADYPLPAAGEAEPYPRITALVLDRVRRERSGYRDESSSPLTSHAWAQEPILDARARVLRGTTDADRSPEERDARARRERATGRNRLLGLAAVGGLVLLTALAYRRVGRVRRRDGAGPA